MIKQFFKKVLISYLIIICCVFTPTYKAYAVSAGGWAFSKYDVATSVVTAMKNGASASVAVAKSPISARIAKTIAGGVIAGVAIPLALNQITGLALTAADYVLDKDNNAIRYKVPISQMKCYKVSEPSGISTSFTSVDSACRAVTTSVYAKSFALDNEYMCQRSYNGGYESYARVILSTCPATMEPQWRSVPIPTVADQVYDNAKTDSDSRSVVNDAVKEYVNEGSADTALDNAKSDADASHACGTGTTWNGSACVADTPSTPTTPDTPFDPSSIIDAINSVFDAVMSLPDVINNALDSLLVDIKDFFQPVIDLVTDFFQWFKDTALEWKNDFVEEYRSFRDWVKSEPDPQPDSKPDINDTPPTKSAQDFDSNYINFGGQCPSFSPTTISVGIVAVPISFNAQPLCDFAILCRPIILALAYFAAMAIVANAIRSE